LAVVSFEQGAKAMTRGSGKGCTVVVTGAGNGIGRAIAARMAADAWTVVGIDRDEAALAEVFGSIDGEAVPGDVRDLDVLAEARRAAEDRGQLAAWVNNAAIVRLAPLHLMEPAVIDEMLDIDLRAVVFGAREALLSFLANGVSGSIVNISSVHARGGFPGYGAYDTAKGGIEAFTRYVCVEYGHLGIRCNAVAPGAVNTQIMASAQVDGQAPPSFSSDAAALAPMRRVSEPAEIAATVAFLLGSASVSINGHCLAVDNGMSAWHHEFPPDESVVFAKATEPRNTPAEGDHRGQVAEPGVRGPGRSLSGEGT
jgi:NAD(P)-dependent dehydrogenase (short-subunit alcohol dehydrogenase family)